MRNRRKQRELRKAGIRKEQEIGFRNGEQYVDPTPHQAVRRMVRGGRMEERKRNSE